MLHILFNNLFVIYYKIFLTSESTTEFQEAVLLWEAVQQIQIDTIRSKVLKVFNLNGPSVSLEIRILPIWRAKAEPKCQFFSTDAATQKDTYGQ